VRSRTIPDGHGLPEGRYGTRGGSGRGRRATRIALGIAGALVGLAVAYGGYRVLGDAPIEAQRTGFSDVDPTSMRIMFEVRRDDPARPAVCIVRVLVVDGTEGGRREVFIPPGERSTPMTAVIRSAAQPVTAEVFGCSYQVPPYLSNDLRPTG